MLQMNLKILLYFNFEISVKTHIKNQRILIQSCEKLSLYIQFCQKINILTEYFCEKKLILTVFLETWKILVQKN